MPRKHELINNQVYHIHTKSIGRSKVFTSDAEYDRMRDMLAYYQFEESTTKFSLHKKRVGPLEGSLAAHVVNANEGKERIVQVIAYCLLPTHMHLVLKQLKENGISRFMADIKNSYSRYFNLNHRRKGPLWEGRFKNVLIDNAEDLAHLTRYIHRHSVHSSLSNIPEAWNYSSYHEYLCQQDYRICDYYGIVNMSPDEYRTYTNDCIAHDKKMETTKHLVLE